METDNYVNWFRNTSPYINAHREKVFVIAIPGDGVADPHFENFIYDLALLNSLEVRIVLVHGARLQIDERLQAKGITPRFHKMHRITDRESLECIQEAISSVRVTIESQLSMGLVNSPMHGSRIRVMSGNLVTARPRGVVDGVDFELTGLVRRIDRKMIQMLLDQNVIVLMSSLGFSPTGEVFHLAYEDVAAETAIALQAEKLVFFTADDGIRDENNEIVRELEPSEIEPLATRYEEIDVDIARQLRHAYKACSNHIRRVHFISYEREGAMIEELFTRDGNGTLLSEEKFEHLSQATIDDVGGILELIAPLEEKGILVHRSRERLETEIGQFAVVKRDGMIVACAALYPFPEEQTGELACVVVHPEYRGRGSILVDHFEKKARSMGLKTLFVLTTHTAHWFIERGYAPAAIENLPGKKKALYNYQRNSKIFIKTL